MILGNPIGKGKDMVAKAVAVSLVVGVFSAPGIMLIVALLPYL